VVDKGKFKYQSSVCEPVMIEKSSPVKMNIIHLEKVKPEFLIRLDGIHQPVFTDDSFS
jgi:hypothetical protein